ncbi:hypothetical protein EYF80_038725 [Liparis tanakae]|uniref:Uncharacterized protein n=1 Tax=Liparis tanakae TaxID=230148 RepID=A0A4Z2GCJ1_9TELE|nr:hypothetical protein EYF80_038725 [Liparis tanakae]
MFQHGENPVHMLSGGKAANTEAKVVPYPSGEYSRLNTAPCVCVLRLTDSEAGFIEQYKLVIVLKFSLAGSTNNPRRIVLLCSKENTLFPLRMSAPEEPSPLAVCGAAGGSQRGSRSSDAEDLALRSGLIPPLPGGEGETLGAISSSASESSMSGSSSLSPPPPLGLSCDSSASSLSLWCSELIVASPPASTQPLVSRGAASPAGTKWTDSGHLPSIKTVSSSTRLRRHGDNE